VNITRPTALTAAVLAIVAVSACSASVVAKQVEPKLALRDSAAWLTNAQVVTADISLTGTAADWSTLSAEAGAKAAKGGTAGAAAQALGSSKIPDAVLTAHVLVTIDRGADGKPNTGDDTAAIVVRAGGKDLLDVFTDTKTVYLKGDAAAITALAGQPQDAASLTGIATYADQALPGAGALVHGQWISLKVADVMKAANQYAKPGSKSDLSGDPAQIAGKLRAALSSALQDVSVANDPKDPSHLVVTGNARAIVTAVSKAVSDKAPDLSQIPSTVRVDAFVAGGNLHEVRLGLNQFSTVKAGPVGVRVLLSAAPALTRPTNATPLDLGKAQMPGSGDSGRGGPGLGAPLPGPGPQVG